MEKNCQGFIGRPRSIPALRLIVEREEEINKFKPEEYWTIGAQFTSLSKKTFEAKLLKIDKQSLDKLEIKSQAATDEIIDDLKSAKYTIIDIQEK